MKSNNSLALRLLVFFFVIFSFVIGGLFWWQDATRAVDQNDSEPIVFTVPLGQSTREIANRLSDERLIRSSIGFFLTVKLRGLDQKMQAGEFRLNKTMDVQAIAEALTLGMQDAWVTIPEGLRVEEIATKLAKEFEIPEAEFLSLAREGYMFPDTYQIPRTASAAAIIAIFTDTFNEKVTPDVYVAAKKQGLTEKELIILASLVEREGKSKEDREMIAGILLNRIHEEWPLQVDATVQYMLGYQPQEKTWWKKNLTKLDLQIDSNFNTYKYPGLPPRPIANPGLEAILAVAYPVDSEYMFYIHDATGKAHYAKTVEEHNTNISQYLQ